MKLVILDAKYYYAHWAGGKIVGQPGIPDVAKQIFYQMVFMKAVRVPGLGLLRRYGDYRDNDDKWFAEIAGK